MAANLYHLLHRIPAVEGWEMPPALEALARRLVQSGQLRISADHARNYVRHGTADTDTTFTARALTDPALATTTRARLARHVAPAEGAHGVDLLWDRLRNDLKKARGIAPEKELRVARVLVQSAHPSVIELLLRDGTEIFVSYAHNVAELMEVRAWETHGKNSGMQATEATGTAVYISAGGDPFFEGEHKTYTTDGFPALARTMVIAGQELGHFADLARRADGAIIGRHSTDAHHSQLRAAPQAREGRMADIRHVAQLRDAYSRAGLARLRWAERGVAFYHTRYRFTPPWLLYQLARFFLWCGFVIRCRNRGIQRKLRVYPYHRHGDAVALFLADMGFNLAPDADVYRDPDPLVEEAIAVIEAVARVPQQVHKWGHTAVAAAWPRLYAFYFGRIIPAAQALAPTPMEADNLPLFQQIRIFLRRARRPRPGYYP